MSAFDVDAVAVHAWDCAIPMKCILSPDHYRGAMRDPQPCHFMVPRQGYLYLNIATVLQEFKEYLQAGDEVWFDCAIPNPQVRRGAAGGTASPRGDVKRAPPQPPSDRAAAPPQAVSDRWVVPLQYPMCVMLDLLTSAMQRTHSTCKTTAYDALPFEVTVHFGIPDGDNALAETLMILHSDKLDRDGPIACAQRHKCATAIMFGSAKPYLMLPPATQKTLQLAIATNDPGRFFSSRLELLKLGVKELTGTTAGAAVPVIDVTPPRTGTESSKAEKSSEGLIRFAPFMIHRDGVGTMKKVDTTKTKTLGQLLRASYFVGLSDEAVTANHPMDDEYALVTVMGSRALMSTPTDYLATHLCCVDLFVHIVITTRKPGDPRLVAAAPSVHRERSSAGSFAFVPNPEETVGSTPIQQLLQRRSVQQPFPGMHKKSAPSDGSVPNNSSLASSLNERDPTVVFRDPSQLSSDCASPHKPPDASEPTSVTLAVPAQQEEVASKAPIVPQPETQQQGQQPPQETQPQEQQPPQQEQQLPTTVTTQVPQENQAGNEARTGSGASQSQSDAQAGTDAAQSDVPAPSQASAVQQKQDAQAAPAEHGDPSPSPETARIPDPQPEPPPATSDVPSQEPKARDVTS